MEEINTPKASILVVDDTRTNLRFLVDMLTNEGYLVRPAPDGELAISSAQAEPPDLILLDIMMPGISGYEVCERLKADTRTRDVPVIFLSALSEVLDKVKAFAVGGVDYITKPFEIKEILARIQTHLSLRNLQKDLEVKNTQLQEQIAERRQVEETLRGYAERLRIMHELDQSILAARSPETIAVAALGRIRRLIPCQRVVVTEILETEEIKPLAVEASSDIALKADVNIYREVFESWGPGTGQVQGIEDLASLSQRSFMQETLYAEGVRTYVIIPLHVHGELVGTMHLEADQPGIFSSEHIDIAIEVAALLAVAIRQARLFERAKREIAERKLVEEALRQRTIELESRNTELDAFAHTVAHDLKTPLTAIIGFGSILQKRFDRMSEQERGYGLNNIVRNGHKMSSIIDELLLLATVRKLEGVDLRPLDMELLIVEALGRMADLLEETQAEITMPNIWPAALGYGPWVEEVWANYLSNAIKYGGRPEDGIAPHVELGYDKQAGAQGDNDREYYRFWVRDNGVGLTEEEQSRLFTLFTRLDKMRVKGHGLGLSIVRRIVGKLGGEVGVESKLGEGSIFFFTLPSV